MEGKKTRGRQKIEMKKIENEDDLLISFSKRRSGIYKKSSELATLCGAEVGFLVFSPSGKPYSFGHPNFESVTNRFLGKNFPKDDITIHLVEGHRQARIIELNKKSDELVEEFELEKGRGKTLEKKLKARNNNWWWQTSLEDLPKEELKQMEDSWVTLNKNLQNAFEEKTGEPASSAYPDMPPWMLALKATSEGPSSRAVAFLPVKYSKGNNGEGFYSVAAAFPSMNFLPQATSSNAAAFPLKISSKEGNPFGVGTSGISFPPHGGHGSMSF